MSSPNNTCNYLDGLLNFPQPFEISNSMMMSFVFAADKSAIQKTCDSWFNQLSGNQLNYQVIAPVVMITFSNNGGCYPVTQPYGDWGYISYQEVIFSIFVARVGKLGPVWVTEHFSAFVPYIFVTNGIVMSAGREVYGMPKTMASVDMPSSPQDPGKRFVLRSMSPVSFKRGQPFIDNTLVEISASVPVENRLETAWHEAGEAASAIRHLVFGEGHLELPGVSALVEIAKLFVEKELPFSSSRQVRSIGQPNVCVYKDVVEFTARAEKFHGGGRLKGDYTLSLPPQELFPIGRDLGLKDGQKAEAAFWINWDFSFQSGKTVWNMDQ